MSPNTLNISRILRHAVADTKRANFWENVSLVCYVSIQKTIGECRRQIGKWHGTTYANALYLYGFFIYIWLVHHCGNLSLLRLSVGPRFCSARPFPRPSLKLPGKLMHNMNQCPHKTETKNTIGTRNTICAKTWECNWKNWNFSPNQNGPKIDISVERNCPHRYAILRIAAAACIVAAVRRQLEIVLHALFAVLVSTFTCDRTNCEGKFGFRSFTIFHPSIELDAIHLSNRALYFGNRIYGNGSIQKYLQEQTHVWMTIEQKHETTE